MEIEGFSIKTLSPELVNDYLYFFDNMVFTEHPDWSKCYCYSFHFTGPDDQWEKNKNRAAIAKLIKSEKMSGYLAYSADKPIGWCNVNKRDSYQRLGSTYALENEAKKKIASIVCFLISPDFRGKGIAKRILSRVISDYSSTDYDFLEAYPLKTDVSCERNYKGPLSMYTNLGFFVSKEIERHFIVRYSLILDLPISKKQVFV